MNTIKEKKIVNLNGVQQCMDCKRAIGRAQRAYSIAFKIPHSTEEESSYKRGYLCFDCEKYYRRSDPSADLLQE